MESTRGAKPKAGSLSGAIKEDLNGGAFVRKGRLMVDHYWTETKSLPWSTRLK